MNRPAGCGAAAGDNRNVCGQDNYLCESCLAEPVRLDDFAAEVSNGWLLMAIKIPSTACAICGVVYTSRVWPGEVWRGYTGHHPLNVSVAPWCGAGWQFVENSKPYPEDKRALVCADCGKPIASAEAGAGKLKAENNAIVAAREWP